MEALRTLSLAQLEEFIEKARTDQRDAGRRLQLRYSSEDFREVHELQELIKIADEELFERIVLTPECDND